MFEMLSTALSSNVFVVVTSLILGVFVGLALPALMRVYLAAANNLFRLVALKQSFFVYVVGVRGTGKTTLISRLVGENPSSPGITLGLSRYVRPIYLRNKLVDVVFVDFAGEGFFPIGKMSDAEKTLFFDGSRNSGSVLIIVVGTTDRQATFPNNLEVLSHTIPRLTRVIVFFNKSERVKPNEEVELEKLRGDFLKPLSRLRGVEVSVRFGSAATGEGVGELFGDITAHIQNSIK